MQKLIANVVLTGIAVIAHGSIIPDSHGHTSHAGHVLVELVEHVEREDEKASTSKA